MFFVLVITADNDRIVRFSMADLLTIAICVIEHSRLGTLTAYMSLMLIVSIDVSENFEIEIFDASMLYLLTIAIYISPSKLDN